ncbi:short-chain dehydrogenase [Porphyromonas crevioricanis]|uniref:Fatty acyl-CoA reductase n=2 Tax=Porphyromonas crevioricanis TaxID=393921 RepID=A0A0A2FVY0_9PORP|nr:SDR family NAD(P)-dependent oxidoreductase [Porphyromonas crevioricanis]KGN90055.1 short-chain dehydrogenase [Porphyromonas crevioricanis]KGN94235.1 short-chain dehydrogenase [Porphyromonas crevioricanis]SJZ69324.1 Short-chain dehydrogenase [Porphyromonas crevioricanis]SQH72261.1 Fatty acyl-CoA reductase [Porphyromonas crevioricanis]GAD05086.1 NAD dependent epimerase/dehydratase family protein [Porphyromonas crevioricanis JCM 15906]
MHLLYPTPRCSEHRLKVHFKGRWVVITGGSSGIGAALARRLIRCGASLLLIARRETELKALCQEAERAGCHAIYRAVDLRRRDDLEQLCEELPGLLPSVDYFFANAGKSICRPLLESLDRAHDFDRTIDLNYRAMVHLALALIPSLKRAKGGIIYTSSVSLLYPKTPHWSAYHASKGAADLWCRTAQMELPPQGIQVRIAYMPLVATSMSQANKAYRHLPCYTADEGAMLLLRLATGRRLFYVPWWARLTAPLTHLFTPLLRWLYLYRLLR